MPTPAPPPKHSGPHDCPYCAKGLPHPPKIHVRVHVPPRPDPDVMDPLLFCSLAAWWAGLFLMGLGVLLDPPKLTIAINPEAMD